MKNKNILKIILDAVMLVLLIMMYNKHVISMKFHEVGGLVALAIVIIHVGLNFKWISTVTKKIFSGKLPLMTRVGYFVNFLLLLCALLIGISGILISRTIFTGIASDNLIWKLLHKSVAASALILIGIHLGLHWTYIKAITVKFIKIPVNIAKPLGAICMIGIIIFGFYSIGTSSFMKWISMPFKVVNAEFLQGTGSSNGNISKGEISKESRSDGEFNRDKSQKNNNTPGNEQKEKKTEKNSAGNANKGISILSIIKVISTYLSIAGVFAILTYWIEKIFLKRKKALL